MDAKPPPAVPATSRDATSFKDRWAQFAEGRRLPADPDAPMPRATAAQARRDALEFFSWGLVHGEEVRRILEEKLPKIDAAALHAGVMSLKQAIEAFGGDSINVEFQEGVPHLNVRRREAI